MGAKNYRDLIVWQNAMDFAENIYAFTNSFPIDEKFSLTSQLRRSAISVPYNIAEGDGRFSRQDFKRFLSIAHGSLREAETQILLAVRLGFLTEEDSAGVLLLTQEIGRLIHGLAKSLDKV
jgi:four helix bundle protein